MRQIRIRRTIFLRLRSSGNRDWALRNRQVGRNKRDRVIAIRQRANRHCITANIGTALASQITSQRIAINQRTSAYRMCKRRIGRAILLGC